MVDDVVPEWRGDSLPPTAANEAAILQLASTTPALEHLAGRLTPDREATGSRAPYFRGATASGDLILKINLSDVEIDWSSIVAAAAPDLAPLTYGSGTLANTMITWLLQERASNQLGTSRQENSVMMTAGAHFHRLCREGAVGPCATGGHPQQVDDLRNELHEAQRLEGAPAGTSALAQRATDDWERLTNAIDTEWCHGDLHPGNVVRRSADAPGLLIGFNPRRSPWIFDAAWLAGNAMVLGVKPLQRWIFDLLREARQRVLGERVQDAEYERAIALAGAWYAVMCWRRLPPDRRNNSALCALVERQVSNALS